jgi:hypothetical protein
MIHDTYMNEFLQELKDILIISKKAMPDFWCN